MSSPESKTECEEREIKKEKNVDEKHDVEEVKIKEENDFDETQTEEETSSGSDYVEDRRSDSKLAVVLSPVCENARSGNEVKVAKTERDEPDSVSESIYPQHERAEAVNLSGKSPPEADKQNSETDIIPFSVCESVYTENETDKVIIPADTGASTTDDKPNYDDVEVELISGKYSINNYLYEKERHRLCISTLENVVYLRCTKAKYFGCKKARAVIVIDKDGRIRVRKLPTPEEHTHPEAVEDVFKTKVKTKLREMIFAYPNKSPKELYEEVVKEYMVYADTVDPNFTQHIPSYDGIKAFIVRQRANWKEEETVRQALTEKQGKVPLEAGKALRTKWKRLTGELPNKDKDAIRKRAKEYVPYNLNSLTLTSKNNVLYQPPIVQEPPEAKEPPVKRTRIELRKKESFLTPVMAGDPCTYSMACVSSTTPPSDSRFELMGKNWIEKLKLLGNEQRIFAEKLINDVLYEAELGRLDHGCRIQNSSESED